MSGKWLSVKFLKATSGKSTEAGDNTHSSEFSVQQPSKISNRVSADCQSLNQLGHWQAECKDSMKTEKDS